MPSIFDLIKEQQRADPIRALDYNNFPDPTFPGASMYAPGAFDAVSRRFDEKSARWQDIVTLIASLRAGGMTDAQLEIALSTISAETNYKEVLRHLNADDVPDQVAQTFRTLAKLQLPLVAVTA